MDRALIQLARIEGGIAVLLLPERSSGQRKSQREVRECCFHDRKNPQSIATAQSDGLKNQPDRLLDFGPTRGSMGGHRERGKENVDQSLHAKVVFSAFTGYLTGVDPFLTTCRGVLYSGDCLEVLRALKSETIDCAFADPPFNLGKDYKNNFNDRVAQAEYRRWCEQWIAECCRALKPGGAFFIYALPELAVQFGNVLNRTLTFRHWIAITMKGTYPRGRKLYPAHYALLYYTRGEPKTFNRLRLPIPTCRHCGGEIKDYGGHRGKMNPEGVNLTDFWEDTSPNRHRKFKVRPGVNELKLVIPERAILMSTNPRDLVLDPFGGGGSTFQAAEQHDRNWIGVELHDCEHIRSRLSEAAPISLHRVPRFSYSRLFRKNEDHKDSLLRRSA